jgi:hypothetical protein
MMKDDALLIVQALKAFADIANILTRADTRVERAGGTGLANFFPIIHRLCILDFRCGQPVSESSGTFGVIAKNARRKTCPLIYPQPANKTVSHEPALSFTFVIGLHGRNLGKHRQSGVGAV